MAYRRAAKKQNNTDPQRLESPRIRFHGLGTGLGHCRKTRRFVAIKVGVLFASNFAMLAFEEKEHQVTHQHIETHVHA